MCRISSPSGGRSILITSAPISASSMAAIGPASTVERSSTRMASSMVSAMAGLCRSVLDQCDLVRHIDKPRYNTHVAAHGSHGTIDDIGHHARAFVELYHRNHVGHI